MKEEDSKKLDTRICLIIRMVAWYPVVIPLLTTLVKSIFVPNGPGDLALSLEKLDTETLRGMPGNVTMHYPNARIVSGEGQEEIAACWEGGGVSTGWVVEG
jgi:hypothetical protein